MTNTFTTDNTLVLQPTGVRVFYRVPSNDAKKPKPVLRSFYVDTLNVQEAEKEVMTELHSTMEVWKLSMLTLVDGGKV